MYNMLLAAHSAVCGGQGSEVSVCQSEGPVRRAHTVVGSPGSDVVGMTRVADCNMSHQSVADRGAPATHTTKEGKPRWNILETYAMG